MLDRAWLERKRRLHADKTDKGFNFWVWRQSVGLTACQIHQTTRGEIPAKKVLDYERGDETALSRSDLARIAGMVRARERAQAEKVKTT